MNILFGRGGGKEGEIPLSFLKGAKAAQVGTKV